MFNTDVVGIIVSYLDRCIDIKTADEVCSFFDLAVKEKEVCNQRWLRESHIEVRRKGNIPEWVQKEIRSDILEYHSMNGKIHRDENGLVLPAMIDADGIRWWYRNGKLHREDKDENGLVLPATIYANGTRSWWINGKRHREDKDKNGFVLPAVIYADGTQSWWINGTKPKIIIEETGPRFPRN